MLLMHTRFTVSKSWLPVDEFMQIPATHGTATHALTHCVLHPLAQLVELLLTHNISGLLQQWMHATKLE